MQSEFQHECLLIYNNILFHIYTGVPAPSFHQFKGFKFKYWFIVCVKEFTVQYLPAKETESITQLLVTAEAKIFEKDGKYQINTNTLVHVWTKKKSHVKVIYKG